MSQADEKVRTIIAEIMGLSPAAVEDAHCIDEDLGADELDLVDLALELEMEFGIEIDDGEFHALKTVGDVTRFIENKVS